ncbi:hypothetical protein TWF506_010988 [Arthrobotrys conoides]|uniref:Uncharacterized protein n=1 Tax=Arthrobotrys conoides TaxID=74498 RepID=A0AAN8N5N1_9PEZI
MNSRGCFSLLLLLLVFVILGPSSLVVGQPTPTATVPAPLVTTRFHVVERLNVHTGRSITVVKQRLQQQLGNLTSPALLSAATDSQANYTATVNRLKGPSGYIWFQTILHGRWFRLWGFADAATYVPKDMTQYTIGNPLDLLPSGRYTLDAFLDAPVRLLVIDTADGGTEIMWERPCTLLTFAQTPFMATQACKELDRHLPSGREPQEPKATVTIISHAVSNFTSCGPRLQYKTMVGGGVGDFGFLKFW